MRYRFYTVRFDTRHGGGSHRSLALLIRGLKELGHELTLVTLLSDGNAYQEAPCPIEELRGSPRFLDLQRRTAEAMQSADADIHIVFGPALMWSAPLYKRERGATPVVAFINNFAEGMRMGSELAAGNARGTVYALKRWLWERTAGQDAITSLDLQIFDSPVIAGIYMRSGRAARNTALIPDPISSDIPAPDASLLKKRAGEFNILYTGRLVREKGVDLLIRAMQSLPPQARLHIVGSGPEEVRLRRLSEIAETRVVFYGWQEEAALSGFYAAADVFVHPCRWKEPFGRTVADAMTHGVPVVTTAGTGSAWVVGDGGIIVERNDATALRDGIRRIMDNAELRRTLGVNALVRAREFDYRRVSAQWSDTLTSLKGKS